MTSVFDVPPVELIDKVAEKLKKIPEMQPPEWAKFAKTGCHKERPPMRNDWWYVRAAAILRSIYKLGPIGVSKLRTKYGGKRNRGAKPEQFRKGSGSVVRKILQQLEKAGLVKHVTKGIHKGRVILQKGQSMLDKAAQELSGKKPVKKHAEKQAKQELKPEDKAQPVKKTHAKKVADKKRKKTETKNG